MNRAIRSGLRTAAATLAAAVSLASPLRGADLVLERQSGYVVPVEVNGQTLRLRVDPGANGVIVLNPAAAERAGLRETSVDRDLARALGAGAAPGTEAMPPIDRGDIPTGSAPSSRTVREQPVARPYVQLGPLLVRGRFGVARARIGGSESERVFAWFDSPAVGDADGLISPAELPYANVTFRLSDARPGERTFLLAGQYAPLSGFTLPLRVRAYVVNVKVSIGEPASIATAAAAAILAQAYRGGWTGDVRRHPIALDVLRPVRPLALARPALIGGLRLRRFLVRIRDHGGDHRLPDDVSADPDEIVVTAPGAMQPVRFLLVLGRDQLASCSSLTYQRRQVRILARCSAV